MIAMAACREELLGQLQRLGCVEIREPETAGEDWSGLLERESSRLAEAKGALAEVNTALAAMRRYGQVKDGLFVKRRLVTEKEFLGGELEAQAKTVTQDVGERLRTLSGIQTEMSRLQARRAGLLPWQDLDLPLEAEERSTCSPAWGPAPRERTWAPCGWSWRRCLRSCWRSAPTSSSDTCCSSATGRRRSR